MVKVRDKKLAASRILVLENIVFPALRIPPGEEPSANTPYPLA